MESALTASNWNRSLIRIRHTRPRFVATRPTAIRCSINSYRLSNLTPSELQSLKSRPRIDFSSIFSVVSNEWVFFPFVFKWVTLKIVPFFFPFRLTPLSMMFTKEGMLRLKSSSLLSNLLIFIYEYDLVIVSFTLVVCGFLTFSFFGNHVSMEYHWLCQWLISVGYLADHL